MAEEEGDSFFLAFAGVGRVEGEEERGGKVVEELMEGRVEEGEEG